MIPRNEGEGLLNYLDRLTLMADERASLQTRFEALGQELATATEADQQLARYGALIEADQNKDSMSGIEVTKLLTDSASGTSFPLMQFANSEINGEANSEQNAHAAQAQDSVAQEETPSDTPENTPVISQDEPANSEINSETAGNDEEEYVTAFDRAHNWVLTQTGEFVAADAGFELDIPEKSAAGYLSRLVALAVIERIAGTGMSRIPSRYRLPATSVIDEVIEEPAHLDRSRLPLDQRLLMEHLEKNGPMSQKLACAQLNWVNSRADRAIAALLEGGLLERRGPTLVAIPDELRGAAD